jgi:hypothetical protein
MQLYPPDRALAATLQPRSGRRAERLQHGANAAAMGTAAWQFRTPPA